MDCMKKQITTSYSWWQDEEIEPTPDEKEVLEEAAINRINEMQREYFTSGELHCTIIRDEKEIDFRGWWELTTKTL